MGPQDTGFLYGKDDALRELEPSGIVGLGRTVRYLEEIGVENLRKHITLLTHCLTKRLKERGEVSIYGPNDPRFQAGILSCNLGTVPSE